MATTEIDYSNTIIYKITCKDTNIKDVYVGHTTNFVQRKHAHKQSCMNPKSTNHACKLYAIIRQNGGWTNWIMEIIHFFKCNNQCEARTKEQEYFILLNATLNSIEPMPTPKAPIKPLTNVIEMNKTEKLSKYNCDICTFTSCNRKDYNRHIRTRKHKMMSNDDALILTNPTKYVCNCGKMYKYRQGLALHKKTCHPITDASHNFVIDKELVMSILKQNADIIKENSELKNMMMEVIKTGTHNTNTTNNTNSHNKTQTPQSNKAHCA